MRWWGWGEDERAPALPPGAEQLLASELGVQGGPTSAPVALEEVSLEGRLLDDAVEVRATYRVTVLAAGAWVTVPLFTKTKGTSIVELPTIANGVLAVRDGTVSLVTNQPGRHELTFQTVERAARDPLRRQELSGPRSAALGRCLERAGRRGGAGLG